MKKFTLSLIAVVALFGTAKTQDTLFFDDFENGTGAWVFNGGFGLNQDSVYAGNNSLTESPVGNYPDLAAMTATMANGVDLSLANDANLDFWAIYSIEFGFDYMYVEISTDGGNNWLNIGSFSQEDVWSPWINYQYSLGGFVGNADVRARFRFFSDGAVTEDGMYIDNFLITSDTTDLAAPLILHTPLVMEEASLAEQYMTAEIIDISGINQTTLTYRIDQGSDQTVTGVNTNGNFYLYTIPNQPAGAWIDYWISATDASANNNTAQTDTFTYISGYYHTFDSAQIDFVNTFASNLINTGCAVRITLPGQTDLVTMLIRNYTDVNRPNDSMQVHVWDDNGGIPGTDLITPFMVYPEATLALPNRISRVDLRPYSSQLQDLTGDIYIGFTTPLDSVWVSQTTPGFFNRTFTWNGSTWTNITDDYMFRAITDSILGAPIADFSNTGDPIVQFTDLSAGSPTSWYWDFDDGNNSILQDPSNTYSSNGTYNVCLTVTNNVTSDMVCKLVDIDSIPPVASFNYDTSSCPTIDFTDLSTNLPTSWLWDFDDQSATSTQQNPSYSFSGNGTYNVMLIATNAGGTDTVTIQVTITCIIPPQVSFIVNKDTVCEGKFVNFTDLSINTPTAWQWSFPSGSPSSSTEQNPDSIYYYSAGIYNVTLIASNQYGSDTLTVPNMIKVEVCDGVEEFSNKYAIEVYPNPMNELAVISVITQGQLQDLSLELYNIIGEAVPVLYTVKGNRIEVSRSNLPEGVYIFKVNAAQGEVGNGKLIIQK